MQIMDNFIQKEVSLKQIYLKSIDSHKKQQLGKLLSSNKLVQSAIDAYDVELHVMTRDLLILNIETEDDVESFRWEDSSQKLNSFKTYISGGVYRINGFSIEQGSVGCHLGHQGGNEFSET